MHSMFEYNIVEEDKERSFKLVIHHMNDRPDETIPVLCVGEAIVRLAEIFGYSLDDLRHHYQSAKRIRHECTFDIYQQ